jgi:hypothetical protein
MFFEYAVLFPKNSVSCSIPVVILSEGGRRSSFVRRKIPKPLRLVDSPSAECRFTIGQSKVNIPNGQ